MGGAFLLLLFAGILPLALLIHLRKLVKKGNGDLYKSLPPGSTGWPLIGESFSYWRDMSNNLPRQFIDRRRSLYGNVFKSNLFGRKMVVSVDPQFNTFVLQNEGRLFEARYPKPLVEMIGKYGLVALNGDLQRKLHGIAVNWFSSVKLKSNSMGDFETLLQNSFATWTGKDILLQDECHRITLNFMAKQLLDLSPSKEMDDIFGRIREFSEAIISIPVKIPGSTYAKGIQARDFLRAKINAIMEERKEHPQVVHNDLLSKLMEEGSLSEEIIVQFLLFLLFAGFDTSSRSMAFSIKFLTDCPTALKQLRDEHEAIQKRKGNDKLTWDDYKSMAFTQCVINETLRLGNVSIFLYREAKQDIEVKGYLIPKGWTVVVFMLGVHLDEKHYDAALTFNPWRWMSSDQVNVSTESILTPFGGGPRLCPGSHLARLEMALFLHHFVTKFRWEVFNEDKIITFPIAHLVKGFPIQVHLRESTH